ncbi:hypothetical protein C8R46DRAFT_1066177 [Mycena filopes]|nr:hypothetical protein C8R46DRAFT_1066177 [Mycena filopes]
MSKDVELGTLVIVVLKAQHLNNVSFWKQDVFAQVELNGESKRTQVDVKGGQNPSGTGDKHRKLEVSCFAKDAKKDENIGHDWVTLETKGPNGAVSRGEVYLEMTFFRHGPAPVGLSALKPKRMARPPQPSPPKSLTAGHPHAYQPDPHPQPSKGLSPSPPSSRGPSRTGRDSPLPPVPQQLAPNHPHPAPGHGRLGAPTLTQVPSILRPRNPKSSPTPIPGPVVEYNSVVPPQGRGYGAGGSPPRTYTPVVTPDAVYDDYVSPPLDRWGSGSNDSPAEFSFPVPTLPGAREPTVAYSSPPYNPPPPAAYGGTPPALDRHGSGGSTNSSYSTPPPFQPQQPPFQPQQPPFQPQQQPFQPPGAYPQSPSSFQPPAPSFQQPPSSFQHAPPSFQPQQQPPPPTNRNNDLPDPYLLARYQSPLPLPPGADKPRERSTSHSHPTHPATTQNQPAPAPAPVQQSKPTPASQSNPDNARLQALRQVEEDAARRRAQELKDRELAMKQVEDEAERRKAQEEKDRELARQLDRELNLGEGL